MKPMSKEVKQRRWKMIGPTLRQDQTRDCNIAMTWATEGKRRRGGSKPPKGEQLKRKGQKQDGNRGRKRDHCGYRDKWRNSGKALCVKRHE